MKNINKIKRLVKGMCAGYQTEDNYCCSEDGICVFYKDSEELPSCTYFEKGVLPLDINLEFQYRQEHKLDVVHKTPVKTNVKCSRCNSCFEAESNRQSYCEKCKKPNDRDKVRLRMKKLRKKAV